MMNIAKSALLALSLKFVYGATTWDYAQNGADWPKAFPDCDTATNEFQSPINFDTSFRTHLYDDLGIDKMNKLYTNLKNDVQILWKDGHTTQVELNKPDVLQKFHSAKFGSYALWDAV